ncbi:hypothetical protein KRR39_08405 [Nocardioides panacis]|uniref:Uncharacterized protein n=1 Tax=Nocardioides panacis TaxID=2849501 RepID=A0A975T176_9ACTN|nr:hypothetical protein [Nocardioides panacis]QWZ09745.1 hypothetical protein KRR39_08405 [Nocardioides panacis]
MSTDPHRPLPSSAVAPGTGPPLYGAILLDPCPSDLRRPLEHGGVILLEGANSVLSGPAGAKAAAENCHNTALWLAQRVVDVRHLLPSEEALAEDLRLRGVEIDGGLDVATDKPLKARVLLLRLAPNLLIHLSTGSRVKLGDLRKSNPVSDDLAETIYSQDVTLTALHEGTRGLRRAAAAGVFINNLEALRERKGILSWMYFGDNDPPIPFGDELEEKLWQTGKAGMKEAKFFSHRIDTPRISQVGNRFVDGRVRFGGNRTPPPGTETAYLRSLSDRGRPAPGQAPFPADPDTTAPRWARARPEQFLYLDEPPRRTPRRAPPTSPPTRPPPGAPPGAQPSWWATGRIRTRSPPGAWWTPSCAARRWSTRWRTSSGS